MKRIKQPDQNQPITTFRCDFLNLPKKARPCFLRGLLVRVSDGGKKGKRSYNLDMLLQSAAMVVKKLLVDEKKTACVFL